MNVRTGPGRSGISGGMMSEALAFGTVINCMDGRVQIPVIEWMKKEYDLDAVDSITVPGPDLVLSRGDDRALKEMAAISVKEHGSRVIAVCGHYDCAGNPADEAVHREHIRKAVERVSGWYDEAAVIGLWIDRDWTVEKTAGR
jgi:hypothetical protein